MTQTFYEEQIQLIRDIIFPKIFKNEDKSINIKIETIEKILMDAGIKRLDLNKDFIHMIFSPMKKLEIDEKNKILKFITD
ncbi:MAG: hypothetical protein ACTSVV_15095 [Promethearchaeota archaeon]